MGNTKIELWKPLVHPFRACCYGSWPLLDTQGQEHSDVESVDYKRRGEPVAEIYKFIPWVLKGDMDLSINHFEMLGHWKTDHQTAGTI